MVKTYVIGQDNPQPRANIKLAQGSTTKWKWV